MRALQSYISILVLPLVAGACAAPMTGARTLGETAPAGAFTCATQAAADFGYTSVSENDGIAVVTKPRSRSHGREDRFIMSMSERFLRIDIVAIEASGSDAEPSAKGLNDAAAILARCSAPAPRVASSD